MVVPNSHHNVCKGSSLILLQEMHARGRPQVLAKKILTLLQKDVIMKVGPDEQLSGVYQGGAGCLVSSSDVGDKNPSVFGRQADLCSISQPSRRGHKESDFTYTVLEFQGECKEKQP